MGVTNSASRLAQQQEATRERNIHQGVGNIDNAFAGFTPQFYQNRAQQYQNFAMPQLSQQYLQTRGMVDYDLANRHLTKSLGAQKTLSSLQGEFNTQKQGVVDSGISQAQGLQQQVENSRSNLLNQLYVSQDPTQAAQGALKTASMFAAPSPVAPIGNMFNNWANIWSANRIGSMYNSMPQSNNYGYGPSFGGNNGVSNGAGGSTYRYNNG